MTKEPSIKPSRADEFLDELEKAIKNPVHERLIKAYRSNNPVQSMEAELAKILTEVLGSED